MRGSRQLFMALIVSCHTPSPAPSPTPSTTPAPIPTPTPTPTASASAPTPVTSASSAPEAPKYIDDLDAWFRARSTKTPSALVSSSCTESKLGGHDALLCHGIPESLPTGESVYPLSVWYVVSGKAELALTTAIGAGPLDREIQPGAAPADDMYVELDVTIDGSTLTIAERPSKPCNKVLAEYTSAEMAGHRRVVQKACAARGKYVLQNGKLVRAP